MGKLPIMLAALVLAVLTCGCGGPQAVEVEVTRIVPQTVEVTRVVPRTVEVTRVIPQTVEVTRVVEVVVTATPQPATLTPRPTSTPEPTDTPELVSAFQTWTSDQAIEAFEAATLEVEGVRPMTVDDYGPAPMTAVEGTRFLIPSLCEGCGGRVFSFASQKDLEAMEHYYVELGRATAWLFSWVFVKDNIVVQINGTLPEEQARQYEAALNAMGQ